MSDTDFRDEEERRVWAMFAAAIAVDSAKIAPSVADSLLAAWRERAEASKRREAERACASVRYPEGVGDPLARCPSFEPGKPAGGTSDCGGDGHYLCQECVCLATDKVESCES